jgi:hypothetical protein
LSGPGGYRSIPKGAFVPGGWHGQPCYTQSTTSTTSAALGLEEEEEERELIDTRWRTFRIQSYSKATLLDSVDNLDNLDNPPSLSPSLLYADALRPLYRREGGREVRLPSRLLKRTVLLARAQTARYLSGRTAE